jgi:hypothetical protein
MVLGSALALLLNACAAKRVPSLFDEQRGKLGQVGLVVVDIAPEAEIDGPTPLGGVGGGVLGAVQGMGIGVLSGAGCFVTHGYVPELCVLAVMTPYWVGRGTVEGAMNAMPESERRVSRDAIVTAIADVDRQQLASAIYEEGGRRSSTPTIMPPRQAPMGAADTLTYRDVEAQGIDTVAEVTLARLGLERRPASSSENAFLKLSVPDVDPRLGLVAEARLRIVSAADDTVKFEQTYLRRSPQDARFAEWAQDNAAAFREACDAVLHALAGEIAAELFGAERPATTHGPETVEGS